MTDTGIEALRAEHERWPEHPDLCDGCEEDWPCPTARLFAERDAFRAALDAVRWGISNDGDWCLGCGLITAKPASEHHRAECPIGPLFGEACDE